MAGLIAALAVLTTAGCASGAAAEKAPSAGPEKPNLVIAAVPTASSAGVYVAQQDGLFRRAGLNVKIVNISAGANVTPELRSGRIDVVNGAYAGFIQAQVHQAAQFHILADGYAGAPNVDEVVVLPGSGISSAKQLEGKTIGVNALGSVAQLLVSSALAAQGVPASRVHFVAVGFPAMSAALKAHHIDAAYLPEPYLSQAEEQTGGEDVLDVNQGATQDFPIDGFAATVPVVPQVPQDRGRRGPGPGRGPGAGRHRPAAGAEGARPLHHDHQADRGDHVAGELPGHRRHGPPATGSGPHAELRPAQAALQHQRHDQTDRELR